MIIINLCEFLQRSIYHRKATANSSVSKVGATPYELFLKVPWINKQLVCSDLTFRIIKKAAGVKYGKS
jgi:hypothetical protein